MPGSRDEGSHLETVRRSFRWSQAQLASSLGVTQATISAWELGDRAIPGDVWLKVAALVNDPAMSKTLVRMSGLSDDLLLGICRRIFAERFIQPAEGETVRIPEFRVTAQGREEAGPPIPLPVRFIPHPERTICISVDDKSTGIVDAPRGITILDTTYEGADNLSALWGRVVMLRCQIDQGLPYVPTGFYIGRLELAARAFRRADSEAVTIVAHLDSLSHPVIEKIRVGEYVEPDAMRGIASDDTAGFAQRMAEVQSRAVSQFRLWDVFRVEGKIIGRLTGHLEMPKAEGTGGGKK